MQGSLNPQWTRIKIIIIAISASVPACTTFRPRRLSRLSCKSIDRKPSALSAKRANDFAKHPRHCLPGQQETRASFGEMAINVAEFPYRLTLSPAAATALARRPLQGSSPTELAMKQLSAYTS
jgi:hypothetical protein